MASRHVVSLLDLFFVHEAARGGISDEGHAYLLFMKHAILAAGTKSIDIQPRIARAVDRRVAASGCAAA
jgi:hypothetical protein